MAQIPPNSITTPFLLTSDSIVEELPEVKARRRSYDPDRLDKLAQPKHWPKSQKFNDGRGKNKIDGKQTQRIVIAQHSEINSNINTSTEPKTKTLRELPNNVDFSQNTSNAQDKPLLKNEKPSAEKNEQPKKPAANDIKSKSGLLIPVTKKDDPSQQPSQDTNKTGANKSQSKPRVDARRKSNPGPTSHKPVVVPPPPQRNQNHPNPNPQPRRQSMDPAFSSSYQNPTKSWAAKRPISNLTARPLNAQQQQKINVPSPHPVSEEHKKLVDPLEFLVAAHIGELMNRRADGTYGSKPWQTFVSTLYRNFVISIDVTGYNLESIKTSVEGRQLTVEGEQVEEGSTISHVPVPGEDDAQKMKKNEKDDEGPKELQYIRRLNFTQHIIPIPKGFSTTDLKIGLDDLLGFVIIVGHIENPHEINTNSNLTVLPLDAGHNGNHLTRVGSYNDPLITKWKKDLAPQNHQVNHPHDPHHPHHQGKISPLNTILDQYKPKPREEDRRTSTLAKLDPKTRSRIRIASDMDPEVPHHEPGKLLENRDPISFWDKKHLVRAAKYSNEPDHEHPHHHKRKHPRRKIDHNQTEEVELNGEVSSTSITDESDNEDEFQKDDKMKGKEMVIQHSAEERIVPAPMEKHPVLFSSIGTSTSNPVAGSASPAHRNKVIGTKYRRPSSSSGHSNGKRKIQVRKSTTVSNNSKKLMGGQDDESVKIKPQVGGKKIGKSRHSKNSETLMALTQAKNLLEGVKIKGDQSTKSEVKVKSKVLPPNKPPKTIPDTPIVERQIFKGQSQVSKKKNKNPPFAFMYDDKNGSKSQMVKSSNSFNIRKNKPGRDLTEDMVLDMQRSAEIVTNMNYIPEKPAHRHRQNPQDNVQVVPLLMNPGKLDLQNHMQNDLKSQLMDQISSSNFDISSPENLSMSLSHSNSNYNVPIYTATVGQAIPIASAVRNQMEFNNNRCKEVTFDQNEPKVIMVASESSDDGLGIFTGNQIHFHPRILGIDLNRKSRDMDRDSESTEVLTDDASTDASFADISSGYSSKEKLHHHQGEIPLAAQTIIEDEDEGQYEETDDPEDDDLYIFKPPPVEEQAFVQDSQDLMQMLQDSERVLEIDLPVDETNGKNLGRNEESQSESEVKGEGLEEREESYKTLRVKLVLPKKHHSFH